MGRNNIDAEIYRFMVNKQAPELAPQYATIFGNSAPEPFVIRSFVSIRNSVKIKKPATTQ